MSNQNETTEVPSLPFTDEVKEKLRAHYLEVATLKQKLAESEASNASYRMILQYPVSRILQTLIDAAGATPDTELVVRTLERVKRIDDAGKDFLDKSIEYQQIAALVCERVELLGMLVDEGNVHLLPRQIKLLQKDMHDWQKNKESRERTFNAGRMLYQAAAQGLIRSDELDAQGNIVNG